MKLFGIVIILFIHQICWTKVVKYELVAEKNKVNLSGKESVDFALTVNGQIPAPVLEFTEGDMAEIKVINNIPSQEVSIHWHGLLLPNEMDGVPYTTTPPIKSGETFTFKFPIRQNGTYWYHSHTNVQEQKGVYGAFIIHKKNEPLKVTKDIAVVVSDWSDEDADQILKNLRKDGDYYLYKKNTIRSWAGAILAGKFGTYIDNEWTRMGGMDLSDVGYDTFLINGKKDLQLANVNPGDRVRLRIINAAASTYFFASLADQNLQVIAADGINTTPVKAKDILLGMAETYDVIFSVPNHKNYELRLTAQDGTGYASGWIGHAGAEKVFAPTRSQPDLYASMDHSEHMNHQMDNVANPYENANDHGRLEERPHDNQNLHPNSEHDQHDEKNHQQTSSRKNGQDNQGEHLSHILHENSSMTNTSSDEQPFGTLTVDDLQSLESTKLPEQAPIRELSLVLDGSMDRYIWHINGKAIHQDMFIPVSPSERVRFIFENKTMMHHPMHLHGHFFRVINKFGDKSPLKHTVDVPPHGNRVIEFYTDEPGYWMLHCHNLYHLKTGMARVVKYLSFTPKPEIQHLQKHDPHLHDHWYYYGRIEAATNQLLAYGRASQTWNEFSAKVESKQDDDWKISSDVFYSRWLDKYGRLMIGANYVHDEIRGLLGFGYKLPMLIESKILVDQKLKLRIDLEKKFQWTTQLQSHVEYVWRQDPDLSPELLVSFMYAPSWNLSYGVKYTGRSFGAGLNYQF